MSHSSLRTYLLNPLINHAGLKRAIIEGRNAYGTAVFLQQIGAIPYQPSYRMTPHGEFNRLFSNTLAQSQKEFDLEWIPSRKEDKEILGDAIIWDPKGGQARFGLELKKSSYELLHMTGKVDYDAFTVDVSHMGKYRKEYCKGQNSRVVEPDRPHIFDPSPNNLCLVIEDDKPIRSIVITQRTGPLKDILETWLGLPLPAPDHQLESGLLRMSELYKLDSSPITGDPAGLNVQRTNENVPPEPEVEVTRKNTRRKQA